jgi:hypothetical protein
MASDSLTYAQGQTATITAQYVTLTGAPIDVPDPTIEVYGASGALIHGPVAMVHVMTGFYYYDYAIPNSLPVATYTIRITGTVAGIPSAITQYLKVVLAGTATDVTLSSKQAELIAALETYIRCAQRIPVLDELARCSSATNDRFQFSWPRWNLTNAEIRKNDEIITSGFTMDYDTGTLTFTSPLHSTDRINGSYNFRWFTQVDELRFLSDALGQMNIEPGGFNNMTLNTVPDPFVGILMMGAVKNALKELIFCLQFQQPKTVFGGKEGVKEAIANFTSLKENNEKEFAVDKKQMKKATFPQMRVTSTPEFTLPGGRSRWFRYLYSTGI